MVIQAAQRFSRLQGAEHFFFSYFTTLSAGLATEVKLATFLSATIADLPTELALLWLNK